MEPSSRNTKARFEYLKWSPLYEKERPFQTFLAIPDTAPDQRRHNLVFEKGEEQVIFDLRGQEQNFSLDIHGFITAKHHSVLSPAQFKDSANIEQVYLPECVDLVKKLVDGADEVFIFDWRTRQMDMDEKPGRLIDYTDALRRVGPTARVHVDQSPLGAERRVQLHFPHRVDELLRGRVRIIKSLWRPLNGPIDDCPLAVCDGRTVKESDLIETDHIKPQFTACTQHLLYNPEMRWYYISDQKNDEVLIFKNYDTESGVTRCAPHSAFTPVDYPGGPFRRQSVEVRALVFTKQPIH
ncbi:conserved hypothetical protein [Talaromyces stipitatus ATCC 10500]|uniref:Methyltransferase n=1 Tax=Talaromyces stipitatus (strain ATCC 10500 / CBS 375.48 / QM 6759 / NRRL 1006) TaxID=441959 RepID=B8MVK4_TALSN|nr:uncharacterized protein TSTA_080390 [Talaromyces stipitatus ATCC 10500]EED11426.1 conserved hypothetical protein [Talaromyces stipitatus ATCC 10500]